MFAHNFLQVKYIWVTYHVYNLRKMKSFGYSLATGMSTSIGWRAACGYLHLMVVYNFLGDCVDFVCNTLRRYLTFIAAVVLLKKLATFAQTRGFCKATQYIKDIYLENTFLYSCVFFFRNFISVCFMCQTLQVSTTLFVVWTLCNQWKTARNVEMNTKIWSRKKIRNNRRHEYIGLRKLI